MSASSGDKSASHANIFTYMWVTGPHLLSCFHLLVSTSCIINHGWVAKVPANPDVKTLEMKAPHPCINKKGKKKRRTDMPIFFYWHIVFCVYLFLENVWSVHTCTYVSFAFLCNVLFVHNVQWRFSVVTNVNAVTLNDRALSHSIPWAWERTFSVHMKL